MEFCLDIIGDKGVNISVGNDSRAGAGLCTEDGAEWRRCSDFPSELYSLSHQRDVCRVGLASRIEGRIVKGIIGGDVKPALTIWMLEGELDGDRLTTAPTGSSGI